MTTTGGMRLRLEPRDEYTHTVEPVKNYNESIYVNLFDHGSKVGGWFRIGNRPNEGYAEVSTCLYLDGGHVGFQFGRPKIEGNEAFDAAGMQFEVVEPFRHVRLLYDGQVCLLAEPHDMADPRRAFTDNPMVPCEVELDLFGVSPMYGGEMVHADGRPLDLDAERAFARGHFEQHLRGRGRIRVGEEEHTLEGFGLRDHSWGPRYWQNIHAYRWLPMSFDGELAMMVSVIFDGEGQAQRRGIVLRRGEYVAIEDARIETDWDENDYQTGMKITARTAEREYEIEGKVLSLVPLRNRRTTPDGETQVTRITEGFTEFRCDGKVGYGMSEYLDQIEDGVAVGRDLV